MRYRDAPTVEVSELIEGCTVERAWAVVADISLPTRADGELVSVEWVGEPAEIAVGARFRGTNSAEGGWTRRGDLVDVGLRGRPIVSGCDRPPVGQLTIRFS